MLSDVPNFVFTIGYTDASWTLKADLVAEFTCRVLAHMGQHGYRPSSARCRGVERGPARLRGRLRPTVLHLFPQAGRQAPWRLGMNYAQDVIILRHGKLDHGALRFS